MPNQARFTQNVNNPLLKTVNSTTQLMEFPTSTDRHLDVNLASTDSGHGLATEAKQDVQINATNRDINNTTSIGDGSSQATALCLGYDRTNGKGRAILVDDGGRIDVNCLGNTVADGSGDIKHLHLDGTGNVQANVVNTINTAPANSANSHITDDPANSFAAGIKGRTTIGTATTETFLLCDSDGHLQVDVLSGGGSSDATAANQSTMITKLGEIDTAQDLTNTKLDAIDSVLDSILVDTSNIRDEGLLQTSTLALHQTGSTNTTFTIADGGNSTSKAVSLSDIRVAQLTPEVLGYKITSTGTGGSGSDVSTEISFDGTNFTEVFSNISASSKSNFIGNLGDDNFGLGTFGTHFRFKISNNSGGSANYTITLCGYGVDFAQADP